MVPANVTVFRRHLNAGSCVELADAATVYFLPGGLIVKLRWRVVFSAFNQGLLRHQQLDSALIEIHPNLVAGFE
tara:strand:- start:123 stop:344 length:222 start_codon:yes stop_codon:yes gene_type:complete